MVRRLGITALLFLTTCLCIAAERESRTWTSVTGKTVEATFLRSSGALAVLQSKSGKTIRMPLAQLSAEDRTWIKTQGMGSVTESKAKPISASEMRKLRWEDLESEDMDDELRKLSHVSEGEVTALNTVVSSWRYGETPHFIIHYQKKSFAQSLARQAEFFYHYVSQDLEGPEDHMDRRSHIFIFEEDQWQSFLSVSKGPEWAGAYVRGPNMFLYDSGDNKRNANVLAHEMTHLILNRFFIHQPANWMNEGLAEWYESFGRALFKGTGKSMKREFKDGISAYPLVRLLQLNGYPEQADLQSFYQTSKYILGFLRLEHDEAKFLPFLFDVVLSGKAATPAMLAHYGYKDIQAFEQAFREFARR